MPFHSEPGHFALLAQQVFGPERVPPLVVMIPSDNGRAMLFDPSLGLDAVDPSRQPGDVKVLVDWGGYVDAVVNHGNRSTTEALSKLHPGLTQADADEALIKAFSTLFSGNDATRWNHVSYLRQIAKWLRERPLAEGRPVLGQFRLEVEASGQHARLNRHMIDCRSSAPSVAGLTAETVALFSGAVDAFVAGHAKLRRDRPELDPEDEALLVQHAAQSPENPKTIQTHDDVLRDLAPWLRGRPAEENRPTLPQLKDQVAESGLARKNQHVDDFRRTWPRRSRQDRNIAGAVDALARGIAPARTRQRELHPEDEAVIARRDDPEHPNSRAAKHCNVARIFAPWLRERAHPDCPKIEVLLAQLENDRPSEHVEAYRQAEGKSSSQAQNIVAALRFLVTGQINAKPRTHEDDKALVARVCASDDSVGPATLARRAGHLNAVARWLREQEPAEGVPQEIEELLRQLHLEGLPVHDHACVQDYLQAHPRVRPREVHAALDRGAQAYAGLAGLT